MKPAFAATVAVAVDVALSLASGAAVPAGGQAEARRPPITAHPSDHTPHVGEQFAVHGIYAGPGPRRHDVKIQTYRDGRWINLDGARVSTRADDSYRVRVVLRLRGVRDLRAVGIAGGGRPNSYARFVVEVIG